MYVCTYKSGKICDNNSRLMLKLGDDLCFIFYQQPKKNEYFFNSLMDI